MSATLISCPACSRQVSMAAVSCIHCGHPIKSSGISMNLVAWLLGVSCALILGLGLYRSGFIPALNSKPPAETVLAPAAVEQTRLTDRELALELQGYVLRANRTLPHKPNPMLTLERITYKPKPHRLTYDYELNVAAGIAGIDLKQVKPALMRRYCRDETFHLASTNGVAVTWRYLELGRVVHQETIHECQAA